MARIPTMRGIMAAAIAILNLVTTSGAATLPRQNDPLQPWVTVDAAGVVATKTPTINAGTTVSAFPGNSALPTANPDGSGAFLVCNEDIGSKGTYQPFCAPLPGSELDPGKTYFITWDPSFFVANQTTVTVEGRYGSTDGYGGRQGFIHPNVDARKGFFAWTPNSGDLPEVHTVSVGIFLVYLDADGNVVDDDPGPIVRVIQDQFPVDEGNNSPSKGPGAVTIAVPVVVGLLALVGISSFVWWYGRRRGFFGGLSKGYGVRKNRSQRAGGTSIRLSDTSTLSRQEGVNGKETNVFREELRRQELER